ncbi:30S ribosomal protein S19 [Candidatus Woesearchaeota archaeon]|nr:30S ribosomal protein S19 [Candidatus Woesearchaeota archaeon]MBW3021527.1 30S ribosomal protein S19 [Candidatus Woesearchaeota archaeon]
MAKKEFRYKGKTLEELKGMSLKQFSELVESRARRNLKRGLSDEQKKVLDKVKNKDKNIKTHCRDMVIVPEMVGTSIKVHNGKEFKQLVITGEMLGHYLGEFALTRSKVGHNAPGIGATKSSSSMSVR